MEVCIIDDDSEDTEIFCEALYEARKNLNCKIFHDGTEALDYFRTTEHSPSFIFLDANLAAVSGKECLLQLRQIQKLDKTKVIIYTGAITESLQREFLELGADNVLVKPARFSKLVDVLSEILGP